MKTTLIAIVAMIAGTAVGVGICQGMVSYFRRRLIKLRRQTQQADARKKTGIMDMVLVFEAVLLIAYTAAAMALFWHTGGEPSTLTACVFGVCGIENGVMGWIKTNKDRLAERDSHAPEEAKPPPEREEPPDVG